MQKVKVKSRPCSECKSATTEYKKIALEFEKRGIKIKVSGIPTDVCPNCGAQYFAPGVSQQVADVVDEIVKAALKTKTKAPDLKGILLPLFNDITQI